MTELKFTDEQLLDAIRSCDGVPSQSNMAALFGVYSTTVMMRIRRNPALEKAMEARGREYLAGMDDEQLIRQVSVPGWITGLPDYAAEIVDSRLDARILASFEDYGDVPTAYGIARKSGLSLGSVNRRLRENPVIRARMEATGKAYLEGISETELLSKITTSNKTGWSHGLPEYARELIDKRQDDAILSRIRASEDLPNAANISAALGVGIHVVMDRMEENSAIEKELEKKCLALIESFSNPQIVRVVIFHGYSHAPESVKQAIYARVDAILKDAITGYAGTPTLVGLAKATGLSTRTISVRIEENAELMEAVAARSMFFTQRVASPGERHDRSYEELARIAIESAEAYDGIPSMTWLTATLGVSYYTVQELFRRQPQLAEALEKRVKGSIASLDDVQLCARFSESGWASNLPDYVKGEVYARVDSVILRAIKEYKGMPYYGALSQHSGISRGTLGRRLEQNPELARALAARKFEYVKSLDDAAITALLAQKSSGKHLPRDCKDHAYRRLDEIILRAIREYEGAPTRNGLSDAVGISPNPIKKRIRANPDIQKAMDEKGDEYMRTLDISVVLDKMGDKGWMISHPERVRRAIHARVDAAILDCIKDFDGAPTLTKVGEGAGIALATVTRRSEANPAILKAICDRGISYIKGLDDRQLLAKISEGGWLTNLLPEQKELVYQKLDCILLDAIKTCGDFPIPALLARSTGLSDATVGRRFDANPAIAEAAEKKGREIINGMSDSFVLQNYPQTGWLSSFPKYAQELVYAKIDKIIMRAINEYSGIPSTNDLAAPSGVSIISIRNRLAENPDLWVAYYVKRGLTADQAVELALERNEHSYALARVLMGRLRNLYAFREMAGIIRCFGHLLNGKTLEVSLYPEPMKKAAEELGVSMDVTHQDMRAFRMGEAPPLEAAQAAVLQGIHRLDSNGLTRLFAALHPALAEGAQVVATYSVNYKPSEDFILALQQNGFEVKDSGILLIEPPTKEALLACGAPEPGIGRITRKMEGESKLLFITAVQKTAGSPIPQLEKLPEAETAARVVPNGEAIDIPEGAIREINARFLFEEIALLPSAPFMVDVRDGEKKAAVLGFDMDPARPKRVEFGVYPGAPQEDFRRIARQLATRIESRNALGIKPGQETRVQMGQLRKLMA
ncbi:MAG: hypothetical protein AB1657_01805 [Candidatus Micrarchaeota archaeon]